MTSVIAAGERAHKVTLQNPSTPVPDGSGGYTEGWTAIADLFVRIQPASASDLERIAAGTVISSASHVVTGPFQPGVTTATRIIWTDVRGRAREFAVAGVVNPEERCVDMVLVCVERV